MSEHIFLVDGSTIYTLHTEKIDLHALGQFEKVVRASHVEYDNDRQGWTVVFPDGSFLAGTPSYTYRKAGPVPRSWWAGDPMAVFPTRTQALAAEEAWIQEHLTDLGCDGSACPLPDLKHGEGRHAPPSN